MTTNEWLMLIQTIIMAGTGAVIYWYAKETQKIRIETSNQNTLLSEQIKLMGEGIALEQKRERSLAEAYFVSDGGSYNPEISCQIRMVNKGATIRNLAIKPIEGYRARVTPCNIIASNEKILIQLDTFPKPTPNILFFELSYNDKLDNKKTQKFKYDTNSGQMEQVVED